MKKFKLLIKDAIFFNEKEYEVIRKGVLFCMIFFVLLNIIGSQLSGLFYNNLAKIILLELIFLAVLINPRNGLFVVLAAVPLEFTETWFHYHQIKFYRIVIIFTLLSWLIRIIIYKDFTFLKFFKDKISILIFLFILWNSISLSYSVLWKDGLGETIRMSFYFIFIICLLDLFKNHFKPENFLYFILGMGLIIAAVGIYEKVSGNSIYYFSGYLRAASTFFDPNMFGRFCAINILISLSLVLFRKNKLWVNILLIAGSSLFLLDIFFTRSRSSVVALLTGISILILFHKKRVKLLFVFVSVLIIIFFFLPVEIQNNLRSIVILNLDQPGFDSAKSRMALEITGLKIIKEHFLFGVGAGSFPFYFLKYNKLPYDASESHDYLTTIFAELGIIGLLLNFLIIFFIFKKLFIIIKNTTDNKWIFVSIFAIITGIFFHAVLYSNFYYYFYLWFFIFFVLKIKEPALVK